MTQRRLDLTVSAPLGSSTGSFETSDVGLLTVSIQKVNEAETLEWVGRWCASVFPSARALEVHALNPFKSLRDVLQDSPGVAEMRDSTCAEVTPDRLAALLEGWPSEHHLICAHLSSDAAQRALDRYVELGSRKFAESVGPGLIQQAELVVLFESTSDGIEVLCRSISISEVVERLLSSR